MLVAQSCLTLRPRGLQPTRLLCPWDFPGKDTGVGCHFLLQGIFPTQGSNPGLLYCRQILYQLSYKGNPFSHICYLCSFLMLAIPTGVMGELTVVLICFSLMISKAEHLSMYLSVFFGKIPNQILCYLLIRYPRVLFVCFLMFCCVSSVWSW